jgi:PAS domain S-box-containing protein
MNWLGLLTNLVQITYIGLASIGVALALYSVNLTLRRQDQENILLLTLTAAFMGLYFLSALIFALNIAPQANYSWLQLNQACVRLLMLSYFMFVLQYTDQTGGMARWRWLALIPGFVAQLFIWDLAGAGHFIKQWDSVQFGFIFINSITYSWAFYAIVFYDVVLIILTIVLLLRFKGKAPTRKRRPTRILLAAIVISSPLVTFNAVAPESPFSSLSAMVGMFLGLYINVFALRSSTLLNIAPVAYSRIFKEMSDGVLIVDSQDRIIEINAAAEAVLGVKNADNLGKPLWGLPLLKEAYQPEFAGYGEHVLQITVGLAKQTFIYQASLTPLRDAKQQFMGRVLTLHDITALRKTSLRQETQNTYLESINRITFRLLNNRNRRILFQSVVDEIAVLLDAPMVELLLVEEDELVTKAVTPAIRDLLGDRATRNQARLSWQAFDTKQPVTIEDYCEWAGHRSLYDKYNLTATLNLPILINNISYGVLALGRIKPNQPFSEDQIRFGQLFANLAGLALDSAESFTRLTGLVNENNKLYHATLHEVEERKKAQKAEAEEKHFKEVLLEIAAIINSAVSSDQLLVQILSNLRKILNFDRASMALRHDDVFTFDTMLDYPPESVAEAAKLRIAIADSPLYQRISDTRQPFLVADTLAHPLWISRLKTTSPRSYLGVPILIGDEIIGFINITSDTPNAFTEDDAKRLTEMVVHVAIAVRNAQAFDEAKQAAAAAERQRLARELHDSATQILFSASLIAQTIPMLIDQGVQPSQLKDEAISLAAYTQGAVAEMRTLLVEMRPDAIENADLAKLITHLLNVVSARQNIATKLVNPQPFRLPPAVQLTFYRVVQEAINNTLKHAKATTLEVQLLQNGNERILTVTDNGRGFALDGDLANSDHFGLRIMRERALEVGAALQVQSATGRGTRIMLSWQQR